MNGETRDIIMNVYIKITTRNMKLVFVKYHLQEYDGNKCEYHLQEYDGNKCEYRLQEYDGNKCEYHLQEYDGDKCEYHLQEYDGNKCEYHLHTLSNISNLCASDEGYSRRNASCALNLISTFLLKEYKYTVEKTEYTIKDHRQH